MKFIIPKRKPPLFLPGYVIKKWRLLDHQSKIPSRTEFPRPIPSINGCIIKRDWPVDYPSLDRTLAAIYGVGHLAWLSTRDFADAYPHVLINPYFWPLQGFFWKGKYYFAACALFGTRSLPAIFQRLSLISA